MLLFRSPGWIPPIRKNKRKSKKGRRDPFRTTADLAPCEAARLRGPLRTHNIVHHSPVARRARRGTRSEVEHSEAKIESQRSENEKNPSAVVNRLAGLIGGSV